MKSRIITIIFLIFLYLVIPGILLFLNNYNKNICVDKVMGYLERNYPKFDFEIKEIRPDSGIKNRYYGLVEAKQKNSNPFSFQVEILNDSIFCDLGRSALEEEVEIYLLNEFRKSGIDLANDQLSIYANVEAERVDLVNYKAVYMKENKIKYKIDIRFHGKKVTPEQFMKNNDINTIKDLLIESKILNDYDAKISYSWESTKRDNSYYYNIENDKVNYYLPEMN